MPSDISIGGYLNNERSSDILLGFMQQNGLITLPKAAESKLNVIESKLNIIGD